MKDMKTQKGHAIYLDVCALGRPYDDQRIRRSEINVWYGTVVDFCRKEGLL